VSCIKLYSADELTNKLEEFKGKVDVLLLDGAIVNSERGNGHS
jgi:hypothetical protein